MRMEKNSGGEAKLQNTENSKPQNRFGFTPGNHLSPFPDRLPKENVTMKHLTLNNMKLKITV
jgi:hypothetical protein